METPLFIKQKITSKPYKSIKKLTIKLTLKNMEKLQQKSSIKKGTTTLQTKKIQEQFLSWQAEKKPATK
jgi:hypothetical protein